MQCARAIAVEGARRDSHAPLANSADLLHVWVKCNLQESLRVNEHGVTVLTTSFNPFTFNTEGMQGAGRTYKVRPDVQQGLGV